MAVGSARSYRQTTGELTKGIEGKLAVGGLNLHLYPSDLRHASRILRITGSLARHKKFSEIHLVGLQSGGLPREETLDGVRSLHRVEARFLAKKKNLVGKVIGLLSWCIRVFRLYVGQNIKCVNPHSLSTLPLAVMFKAVKRCKIVYDTHELETETGASGTLRRKLSKLVERLCIPFVDQIVVVSDPIGDWYSCVYGRNDVKVIRNYPQIKLGNPTGPSILRSKLGIPAHSFCFIYHGLIAKGRGIELMLNAFSNLNDKSLVVMGMGPLTELVKSKAQQFPNIFYLEPVNPNRILDYVSGADVGLALIENVSLSYYYSCPNKILETLGSGVPVLASNFPAMKIIIDESEAGWCVEPELSTLMELLQSIAKVDAEKLASKAREWSEIHNWETQEPDLIGIYSTLFP